MQKILLCITIFISTASYTAHRPDRIPFQVQVNGHTITVCLTRSDIDQLKNRTAARLNGINLATAHRTKH